MPSLSKGDLGGPTALVEFFMCTAAARKGTSSRAVSNLVPHPASEKDSAQSSCRVTPAEVRRGMKVMFVADSLGMIFFSAIQGAIFNFYIEDLGLKNHLGFFMGLSSLGGIGALFGAWLQEKTSARWAIFYWGTMLSRLLWLVIGGLPFFFPDKFGGPQIFPLLAVALFLYFFIGSMGGNAWLSWMSDLLPEDRQGRWWGFRQIGVMGVAALSRVGFGWYLEGHRGWDGYFTIYVFAVGVVILSGNGLYLLVKHPRPKTTKTYSLKSGLRMCMGDKVFRRFLTAFLVWFGGNALMAPAFYLYLREKVGMGVAEIAGAETLSLLVHSVLGFLWGHFADRHGRRGALFLGMTLTGLGLLPVLMAGHGDVALVYLAFAVCPLGGAAIAILMWPMIFSATETLRENRSTAIAVFTLVLSICNFCAFNLVEPVLYPLGRFLLGEEMTTVYAALIVVGVVSRLGAALLALRIPVPAYEVPPGIVVRMFTQTNPLRAAIHLVRYVTTGRRRGEGGPLSEGARELEQNAAHALRHAVAYSASARRSLTGNTTANGAARRHRADSNSHQDQDREQYRG